MVFGNLNEASGTGVCFSRYMREGGNIYGNYLPIAEGDNVALNDHRTAVVCVSIERVCYDWARGVAMTALLYYCVFYYNLCYFE